MKLLFSVRNFIFFSIAFILFTLIGTLSHEYGHILVAKSLGYKTTLHYGSMNYQKYNTNINDTIIKIFERNKFAIKNKKEFPEKVRFYSLAKKQQNDSFLISLGGPIQTMLTGIIGFLLLYKRNKITTINFSKIDWLYVFLALFWLRQLFNPIYSFLRRLINNNASYFGRGDETEIAEFLNIPKGTFDVIFGLSGLIISLFVIFKFIPLKYRLTFVISGLIGSSLGFYIWMYKIGPIILP
ncbi:hypothetical protein FLGE108171_04055 [Flavobacterium gelidilacus]|uniref:hypothetical protein n=1 Tax=Flavobacterium gelidilacus TaxID=206041 RepID=UPI0003F6A520|nr:hypothetical protein [Flavobacterium gelidilacus]